MIAYATAAKWALGVVGVSFGVALFVAQFMRAGRGSTPPSPEPEENAAILSADAYRALRPRDEITEAARRADARMAQEPRDRT